MQLNPRTSFDWRLKSVIILLSFAVSFYATFFAFQSFAVRRSHLATLVADSFEAQTTLFCIMQDSDNPDQEKRGEVSCFD